MHVILFLAITPRMSLDQYFPYKWKPDYTGDTYGGWRSTNLYGHRDCKTILLIEHFERLGSIFDWMPFKPLMNQMKKPAFSVYMYFGSYNFIHPNQEVRFADFYVLKPKNSEILRSNI
jgi:hypothetical protein